MRLLKSIFGKLTSSSQESAAKAAPTTAEDARLLGNRHLTDGKLELAEACYRDALRLNPDFAEAYNNLGFVLKEQRRFAEAMSMLDMALLIKPDLGPAYLNQGVVALELEHYDDAEKLFRQAGIYLPGTAECRLRLGDALFALRRFDEATICYQAALDIDANLPGVRVNLGSAYYKLGKYEEAELHYRLALEQFKRPDAAYFLGIVQEVKGDRDKARLCYWQAIELRPDYLQAHWNLAILSLLHGDYSAAIWASFERRLDIIAIDDETMFLADIRRYLPTFGADRYWHGADLAGKRLLVWAEQGLGDTLMIMRYFPLLKALGAAEVLLYIDPPLVRIAETLGNVDRVIAKTQTVPDDAFDLHVSALSLPARFAASPESLSKFPSPYLYLPEDSVRRWATRCSALSGHRVGLVWGGNKDQPKDALRSIPLAMFAPLMEVPGIEWVSLQKGEPAAQLKAFSWPINDWMDECQDMFDTAALIANLDLVISVDTSVAHLVGALGRPVWLLNRHESEWRWMLGREDSPWYPSMRIFTQPQAGDWAAVIARVRDQLRRETSR